MARQEHDREDILREATGLIGRIELKCDGSADSLVAGFRRDGACSLFFGQDEVYQFDREGAWRRGYWQGRLLKSESGRLIELVRERTPARTWLVRRELDATQSQQHRERLQRRLAQLVKTLSAGQSRCLGEVRAGDLAVSDRLQNWLADRPPEVPLAQRPGLAG